MKSMKLVQETSKSIANTPGPWFNIQMSSCQYRESHCGDKTVVRKKTELMSRSIQQATCAPNLKNLSWFMRPWLQKVGLTYFWLLTRSKWPNCDATQMRHVVPPIECIYQVSNWYLKACWRKVRKTRTDGRTDWRTDGHTLPRHNTSRFSNGRIKKWSGIWPHLWAVTTVDAG